MPIYQVLNILGGEVGKLAKNPPPLFYSVKKVDVTKIISKS